MHKDKVQLYGCGAYVGCSTAITRLDNKKLSNHPFTNVSGELLVDGCYAMDIDRVTMCGHELCVTSRYDMRCRTLLEVEGIKPICCNDLINVYHSTFEKCGKERKDPLIYNGEAKVIETSHSIRRVSNSDGVTRTVQVFFKNTYEYLIKPKMYVEVVKGHSTLIGELFEIGEIRGRNDRCNMMVNAIAQRVLCSD